MPITDPRPLRARDLPEGLAERLLARVDAPGHHASICWLWQGHRGSSGYGQIRAGRLEYVHRVAFALWVGPIPAGREVDHRCFEPGCMRPSHLRLATRRQNARGQRSALATVCKRGHDALVRRADGRRRCAQCAREWRQARAA